VQRYNDQIKRAFMVQMLGFDVISPDLNRISRVGEKLHSGFTSTVVLVDEQKSLLICPDKPPSQE
jgi:hypothetical protein